jgi:hemerythrin superfamily protein
MVVATKPAARKPAAKPASKSPNAPKAGAGLDAIALLKADHAEVKKCFQAYQKLVDAEASAAKRRPMAEQICLLLTVHATIEEEIFYPASRKVLGDDADLVDEADVEHASAKDLIAQIRGMDADDDHYDAKVKVLGEYIDHHVGEEQDELFPKVKKAGLDVHAIGAALSARKQELMAEMTEGAEAV